MCATGLFTVAWYAVFEPTVTWQAALKDGLALGAVAGGLYGFGQAVIGKKDSADPEIGKIGESE